MENAGAKKQKLKYLPPVPIQMVDNEEEGEECTNNEHEAANQQHSQAINNGNTSKQHLHTWASDVRIGDCTIVTGSGAGQKFAVWSINIETSKGGHIHLLKRYSEFDELRNKLVQSYPDHITEIPKLPPKKAFGNLKNDFLVKRRKGLEFFISCVLLNPVLSNSDIVKRFASESAKQ
ncbi:unnamed protein product [Wickerhamomyces anomalus]